MKNNAKQKKAAQRKARLQRQNPVNELGGIGDGVEFGLDYEGMEKYLGMSHAKFILLSEAKKKATCQIAFDKAQLQLKLLAKAGSH